MNPEAISEAGRGDDIVFFNRSGYTKSPRYSTLFWRGDRLSFWDDMCTNPPLEWPARRGARTAG